jgi:nitrogen PTS system EIIA component
MTVQDVANMLKVCPRTVLNMANKGDIPASRIGHLWRFEEESLIHWLKRKSAIRPFRKSSAEHGSFPEYIMNHLGIDHVHFKKSVTGKREVLEDIASLAVRTGVYDDYGQILQALELREEMISTAVDEGIAFPHPRHPIPGIKKTLITVLIVESGVDFGAPGGGKTHIFIMFCAPDDATHVRILARLAQLFHNQKKFISRLKKMSDPESILCELVQAEEERANNNN